MMDIFLSIVIPVYNEEKRIGETLTKIKRYLRQKRWRHEIIVVDDGSTDSTESIVREFKDVKFIKNEKNMGKGYSVKRGLLYSKGRYALFTDADLSTPIAELDKLFRHAPRYDIIIGSRKKKGANVVEKQAPWRILAGNLFPVIVNIVLPLGISDTQCGFKLFDMRKARKIIRKLSIDGFGFDVQLLYLAKKHGLRIEEVGVDWYNDPASKVHIVRHSIAMFFELLRIRFSGT